MRANDPLRAGPGHLLGQREASCPVTAEHLVATVTGQDHLHMLAGEFRNQVGRMLDESAKGSS